MGILLTCVSVLLNATLTHEAQHLNSSVQSGAVGVL